MDFRGGNNYEENVYDPDYVSDLDNEEVDYPVEMEGNGMADFRSK